jgi:hypothetical protein
MMRALRRVVAAFGLAFLASGTAIADDLTMDLSFSGSRGADEKGRFARLFISSTNVRYRTRAFWGHPGFGFGGNQDWLFNVASGQLMIIDHDAKQYAETMPAQREERDRLEREETAARQAVLHRPDVTVSMQKEDCVRSSCEFRRACSGYSCDVYEVSTDVTVGTPPLRMNRHDMVVTWTATSDLQVPAFFAFQDAVRYELCADDEATLAAYAELKKSGLFPLARSLSNSEIPTHGAADLMFRQVEWGGSVLKGPIDPAIFTVVPTDSVLSPALPADYQKVDSRLVACIASLRKTIELIKTPSQYSRQNTDGRGVSPDK